MPQSSQDPVLNEKWLMRAAWWVAHKQQLRNGFAAVVLLVSGIAILYSAYGFGSYFIYGRANDERMVAQLVQSGVNHAAVQLAQPLSIPTVVVLPGSGTPGHYDVLAKVVNPNPNWIADVKVNIATSDQPKGVDQTITMLNNDEQFLIGAGLASSTGSTARASIANITWHRLRNVDDLNSRKPKFNVTAVHFVSSPELNISGNYTLSQVTFNVENQSIYNFWSVDFTVVVMRGDAPQGAAITTLSKLLSNEKRDVTINFYGNIPTATNVLVIPYVNVADDGSFMQIPSKPIQFQ